MLELNSILMGRPGLRNYDDHYEARRGNRKRAKYSGEVKFSDNRRQKISRLENVDADYVEFVKLLYNYDINSQSYTNEHGNDVSYDEVEDEDDTDPQYKIFLANAKRDGRSYILNLNRKDEFPVSIKYEKESACNNGCKCFCCQNQKDMETQKDAVDEAISLNICSKDELKNRRFPRTDPRYDSNRSMGGMDVILPSDPTSQRNNENMSRKLSTGQCGASKKQGKCETKIKSCVEKMVEKGSKLVHVRDKDKASDVGEDYALLLENLQCEKWGMKASLSGCNIKYEASDDDLEILYDSNDMLKKVEALTLQLFLQKITRVSSVLCFSSLFYPKSLPALFVSLKSVEIVLHDACM